MVKPYLGQSTHEENYKAVSNDLVLFRQKLRNLLAKHGIYSNPAWSEDEIVIAFKELLENKNAS